MALYMGNRGYNYNPTYVSYNSIYNWSTSILGLGATFS